MKNDKELIERLGGPAKLAQKLGFTVQRVQNWTARGIPAQVKLDHPDLFLSSALLVDSSSEEGDLTDRRERKACQMSAPLT